MLTTDLLKEINRRETEVRRIAHTLLNLATSLSALVEPSPSSTSDPIIPIRLTPRPVGRSLGLKNWRRESMVVAFKHFGTKPFTSLDFLEAVRSGTISYPKSTDGSFRGVYFFLRAGVVRGWLKHIKKGSIKEGAGIYQFVKEPSL